MNALNEAFAAFWIFEAKFIRSQCFNFIIFGKCHEIFNFVNYLRKRNLPVSNGISCQQTFAHLAKHVWIYSAIYKDLLNQFVVRNRLYVKALLKKPSVYILQIGYFAVFCELTPPIRSLYFFLINFRFGPPGHFSLFCGWSIEPIMGHFSQHNFEPIFGFKTYFNKYIKNNDTSCVYSISPFISFCLYWCNNTPLYLYMNVCLLYQIRNY